MQPADFGLLTPAWAATPAAATASDAAFAQAMLDVEAAWARVQAKAGLCTAEDAAAITASPGWSSTTWPPWPSADPTAPTH